MKKILCLLAATVSVVSCGVSSTASKSSPDNDGIVDIGYMTVENEKNTYAINRVEVGKSNSSYTSIWEYLRGRVPGLQIGTAAAGQTPTITIRGEGSINSGTQPLFVVDGVTVSDIESLDPNDVYSVDVMKDASTAIYGSRGANGVIVIKTKSAVNAARELAAQKKAERQAKKAAK